MVSAFGSFQLKNVFDMSAEEIWKQRNVRVFNRLEQQVVAILASQILDEIKDWKVAQNGVDGLQRFVRE